MRLLNAVHIGLSTELSKKRVIGYEGLEPSIFGSEVQRDIHFASNLTR